MFDVTQSLRSLVIVSWLRADYHVGQLVRGLGLGLTGCKPFLPRAECARLRTQLLRLEMLTRRLLVLLVLQHPLPPVTVPARKAAATRRAPSAPTGSRSVLAAPVFRLTDPAPRAGSPSPCHPCAPLRPRLLYLDQPLPPPEPGEFPPRPDDLIPSAALVARVRALNSVFLDSNRHIARMARRLARDRLSPVRRFPVADPLPPAVRSRRQDATERAATLEIHDRALGALARLDTS